MGDIATAASRVAAMGCNVLWVGKPGPALTALPQRGARVEQVGLEQGVEQVTRRAPDLIVLNAGNARAVVQFARALRKRRSGTTTPVIVLCDDDSVAPLQAAERSGIVARLGASASGEEVARALDTQLRTQTEPLREQPLPVTASELAGWIALSEKKGVCGVVLAQEGSHVMVLGPGGATVPSTQRFRDALVAGAKPSLSFLQLPAARMRVLTELARTPPKGEGGNLPAVRVAVVHPDSSMRSAWERYMAFAGAEVLFDEVQGEALATLGEFAPDLLVVHEDALLSMTRAGCWRDVRLQFSSLLVVSASCADEIHPHDLVAEATRLLATQARVQARIAEADLLIERVETLGPERWLREMKGYDGLVELRVHTPQGIARVRMDNGELHDAHYWRDGEALQGTAALTALSDARFGSLIVGPPQQVADADPGDRWRALLDAEPPQSAAIAPSTPAESATLVEPTSSASPAAVEDETIGAAADELEAEPQTSPKVQPELALASRPDAAPAIASSDELAGHAGASTRARAIAAGALASLLLLGIAVGLQASRSRDPSATAPTRGIAQAVRPVAPSPSSEVVAIPSPGGPLSSPRSSEALLEEPLSVTQPASEEELGAAQPAPDIAPAVAEASVETKPEHVLGTQAQPEVAVSAPAAATSTASPQFVRGKAGPGAPELPVRLRRWLQPTAAQQRVIDAFWARVDQNFAKAERLLSEAHTLNPSDAEVAYQLALTYARQGRLEQTLSWARKARELSPLDPAPVALEGDIHALRGKPLEAELAWKQCLRLRPGYAGCVRRLEQARHGR